MTTMDHHDAQGPEEALYNLPPVVPTGPASGRSATSLWQASQVSAGGRFRRDDVGFAQDADQGNGLVNSTTPK
jgi:hypothetical protein